MENPASGGGPARRGWSADLVDVLAILFAPRRAFRTLAARRPLLVPWLLAAVPTVVLNVFVVSIAQRASVHLMDTLDDPDLVAAVSGQLQGMKMLAVVTSPLALLLRWGVLASLLWAVGTFALPAASLRTMLCIVACSGLPDVIGRGLDLWVTWTAGPEFTPELVPQLTPATSFAVLFPRLPGTWLPALLERLTPFTLWAAALWAVGIREMEGTGWGRAAAVAAPVWLLALATGTAAAVLTGSLSGGTTLLP